MDYFAILGEQRRPWLDPETLKQKFLALSAEAHPDRVHAGGESKKEAAQQRFTQLNQAYQKLRDPKDRLQHLLELETGAPPTQVQRVPAELMDLAMQVGQACKEVDAFLQEKTKVTSPLLQVELFERGQEWIGKLTALRSDTERRTGEIEKELQLLDAGWEETKNPAGTAKLLVRLESVYRLLSYYNRWRAQLQERITRLSF